MDPVRMEGEGRGCRTVYPESPDLLFLTDRCPGGRSVTVSTQILVQRTEGRYASKVHAGTSNRVSVRHKRVWETNRGDNRYIDGDRKREGGSDTLRKKEGVVLKLVNSGR